MRAMARRRTDDSPQQLVAESDSISNPVAGNDGRPTVRMDRRGRPRATLAQSARAKHAFLESYAQWANITAACQAAGVARRNVYNWQEHDSEFALKFQAANDAATERLEREAWRRAVDGSPYERTSYWHGEPVGTDRKIEYSDQLMMLLLRARRPDLYREKVDVAVNQIVKTIAGVDPASVL
jgi:hypothetical protein